MRDYVLTIEAPLRPVTTKVPAANDEMAIKQATKIVSATCMQQGGLDSFRTHLKRPDGSYVFKPVTIAAMVAHANDEREARRAWI